MPGLTVDTSSPPRIQTQQPQVLQQTPHTPQIQTQQQQPQNHYRPSISTSPSQETVNSQALISSSASPVEPQDQEQDHAPPYSPLTPTLAAARLASHSEANTSFDDHHQQHAPPQRQTYTHSQPTPTAIAAPPPVPIAFDDNPDALALKSAISILQLQRRTAERDIKVLRKVKERALADPEAFRTALEKGEIQSQGGDGLFEEQEGDDEDVEMYLDGGESGAHVQMGEYMIGGGVCNGENACNKSSYSDDKSSQQRKWEKLPKPQNVIRCPPVNWNQYAVVGESLDKLHQDQISRPNEGMPQRFGSDGQYHFGGDGQRRGSELGNALSAPYTPGKDKFERMGTRKGGKR